jgi:hypothetical protein
MNITYSECVSVALVIQHSTRMRPIILSSVACLGLPCFSTLSHKRHDFREKSYLTQNVFFLFSIQRLSETFVSTGSTERDISRNVHRSSSKVPLFL